MTDAWGDLATYRQKKRQRFKVYLTKGVSVNPKAYCCDDNTINDQKPPVAILVASPNPIYAGEDLTLDMTGSYDPDAGGIPDPGGYHIWDGIGGDYAGTKTEAGITYAIAGRYEARGVVTDTDGLMGEASTWVEVLSANGDNPPEEPGDWRKSIYLSTLADGIFYTEDFSEPGGGDPEWGTENDGLVSLVTTQIIGDPFDPAGRQYTTSANVVYRRVDGAAWVVILNRAIVENDLGFVVGPWRGNFIIRANINAEGHIYALIGAGDAGVTYRLWFAKSTDYGDNWVYTLISTHGAYWRAPENLAVGAFQGSSAEAAGQVIYASCTTGAAGNLLYVSTNQGTGFGGAIALPTCGVASKFVKLSRDPSNQDVIYCMAGGFGVTWAHQRLYKSINRGGDFTDLITCSATKPMSDRPSVYIWDPLHLMMAGGRKGDAAAQAWNVQYVLNFSDDGGVTLTEYANADSFPPDMISRVMDAPEFLYGMQADDPDGGDMQHVIAVSADRGLHWEGKAGDDPVTPSATSIPNDCGGVSGILQIWTEE